MKKQDKLKSVLITGAASGIGKVAAEQYSQRGIKVAALDVNESALTTLANSQDNITAYPVDVTNTKQVQSVVNQATQEAGTFNRVINAAAIMPCGNILDHDTENMLKVMQINYGGLVNITKAALPAMIKKGEGDFIVFSSMLGIMPTLMTGAYSASKFATSVFTEVLAQENKHSGIRFACICPPAVKTPLLDQVRNTAWPKIMDETPPISIQEVLNAMEKGVSRGKFWIYPGKTTAIGAVMRRLFPQQVWKHIHKTENG